MNKILIASIAGALVYFVIGWFAFEFLLGSYMGANTTKIAGFKKSESESSMLLIFISCTAYSILLSVIMGKWTNIHSFTEGLVLGSIIGFLVAIMTNTYWYATSNFFNSYKPLLLDVMAAAFTVGIMGGSIGWILGKKW